MNESRKLKIAKALSDYKRDVNISDKALGERIGNMSASAVNHILNLKFQHDSQLISNPMFERVASFLNLNDEWTLNKMTGNFRKVQFLAEQAKTRSESYAIAAPPGMSKTAAAVDYAATPNVYFIGCEAHFTKRVFLEKIAKQVGVLYKGDTINDIVDRIVDRLNSRNKPLLIIDEADKLGDNIFQFFITFYNRTINNCGYLFLGSVFFERRVLGGVKRNRQGYAEFQSRIGEFIHLSPLIKDEKDKKGPAEITEICYINGLRDEMQIREVINTCNNDLRFVKRRVEEFRKANRLNELKDSKLKKITEGNGHFKNESVHAN